MIPNHYSASLSELDLRAASAVPPGGNWKNIPHDIPLKRLTTIRESFGRGEGSRSTYYGRLHPDRPAYTINTYFSRPGNGCHLHPSQNRVMSQREAARFQSFPDDFMFHGSKASVNIQIGNAVPPLLGFLIAKQLGEPGGFVDLFSGAGGLSLGFKWAGWQPIVANDIHDDSLKTYASNVHRRVVHGDIRNPEVRDQVVKDALQFRRQHPAVPLWVIGGPPCQGFSTAGKRRSMADDRNQLFVEYVKVLSMLSPEGFVFENVLGLLNMEGGRVFDIVRSSLLGECTELVDWVLSTENHAIPQRRKRVILVGSARSAARPVPPPALSRPPSGALVPLREFVTVGDAISDLPPLEPGQDGSDLNYLGAPMTAFQSLMRGLRSVDDYVREYSTLAANVN